MEQNKVNRPRFIPGDTAKFRVSPGNVVLKVVAFDGVIVTVNDGAETFPVAAGDVYRVDD